MSDEKTEKKTTPDSTKRYRLALAAMKNVEQAKDHEVFTAIDEFDTFWRLYVAARTREVDSRSEIIRSPAEAPGPINVLKSASSK